MKFADVILPLPLPGTFTYALPESFADKVQVGCRLLVPFGKKKTYSGIVALLHDNKPTDYEAKDALELLDEQPVLLPNQLRLWRWIADYYLCTLGEVYKAALPGGMKEDDKHQFHAKTVTCVRLTEEYMDEARLNALFEEMKRAQRQQELLLKYLDISKASAAITFKNPALLVEVERQTLLEQANATPALLLALRDRGVLEQYEKPVGRLAVGDIPEDLLVRPLSEAQQRAFDGIHAQFLQHNVCLLHGVTSSGKTEIYIHLIRQQLQQKRQVLYLLPEIVLTTQLVERLKRVFGDRLGVYHSKYPDAERVEIWQKQLSDQPYEIIVGVRSSVFLPFQNLGLVIVDEEHETSFKQQDPAPRYHARNVALVLASYYKAKTLLGSATPSLESYYNVERNKYGLVSLTERYQQVLLPEIEVVDMKEQLRKKMTNGPFSSRLLVEMRRAMEQHEQVILFQNRRGFAPTVECHVCGWVPKCQHCDVSLTYHKRLDQLTCHYCGCTYQLPQVCPQCESTELRHQGYGTERVEDLVKSIFPEARVARMDLDTTRSRQAYEQILSDFQHGRTDVLVGTQMVTKGLDFDRVSVVGILNADTMLNQPDFRSYEHAFQMMTQVAGRAGRRQQRGRVILQTKNPTLPLVSQVVHADYEKMYAEQSEERRLFRYPPFCRIVNVYMKHRDEHVLNALAADMAKLMRQVFAQRVMGPDTPPVGRVQMMFIRKIVLKVELQANMDEARQRLRQIQQYLQAQSNYKSAIVYYDVDPV